MSRGQLLLEHAATLTLEIARIWLAFAVIAVGAAALFSAPLLHKRVFWIALMASAVSQVLIYSFGIWILRMRSLLLTGLIVGAFSGGLISVEGFVVGRFAELPAGAIGGGLLCGLVLAAVIFVDAARRWMRTDLA